MIGELKLEGYRGFESYRLEGLKERSINYCPVCGVRV